MSEFLGSEWLLDLTADERGVLTRVSPLEWLSGPLCNQVLDRNDAGEVLHRVFHDRMLLIPLDRRGDAYRMHGLLHRHVAGPLRARPTPMGCAPPTPRASAWFEAAGDIDRAVHHAVARIFFDLAERLVVAWSPAAYTNGHYTTVQQWIGLLPRARVVGSTALCLSAALTTVGLGRPESVSVWLRLGEHSEPLRPTKTRWRGSACSIFARRRTSVRCDRRSRTPRRLRGCLRGSGTPAPASRTAHGVDAGDDGAIAILREGAEEASVLGAPGMEAYCTAMSSMIAHTDVTWRRPHAGARRPGRSPSITGSTTRRGWRS